VVVISRPSVTAAFALSSKSVHVTVTTPAARAAPTVIVAFLSAFTNAEVDLVAGEVIVHLSAAWASTRSAGNRRTMVLVSASAVEVVKEMVALLPVPTAAVKVSEGLVMAPIAGTVTYAAVLSADVSIFNPVVPPAVATNSGFADNVSPVHVITTNPIGSVEPVANVIVTLPLSENLDVDVASDDLITHRLSAWAVT